MKTFIASSIATAHRIHECLIEAEYFGLSNFEVIQAPKTKIYWHGHLATFRKIMQNPAPFVILEDDARLLRTHPAHPPKTPEDADAVYLGTEIMGHRHTLPPPWKQHPLSPNEQPLYYQEHSPEWLRIGGMMGTHAVVVLNDDYRRRWQQALHAEEQADVAASRIMPNCRVYAATYPYFFQADGHNDWLSQPPLDPTLFREENAPPCGSPTPRIIPSPDPTS